MNLAHTWIGAVVSELGFGVRDDRRGVVQLVCGGDQLCAGVGLCQVVKIRVLAGCPGGSIPLSHDPQPVAARFHETCHVGTEVLLELENGGRGVLERVMQHPGDGLVLVSAGLPDQGGDQRRWDR